MRVCLQNKNKGHCFLGGNLIWEIFSASVLGFFRVSPVAVVVVVVVLAAVRAVAMRGSFLPFLLPSLPPSFLHSCPALLASFLPSFLASFLPSFLPVLPGFLSFFLPSCPPCFLPFSPRKRLQAPTNPPTSGCDTKSSSQSLKCTGGYSRSGPSHAHNHVGVPARCSIQHTLAATLPLRS